MRFCITGDGDDKSSTQILHHYNKPAYIFLMRQELLMFLPLLEYITCCVLNSGRGHFLWSHSYTPLTEKILYTKKYSLYRCPNISSTQNFKFSYMDGPKDVVTFQILKSPLTWNSHDDLCPPKHSVYNENESRSQIRLFKTKVFAVCFGTSSFSFHQFKWFWHNFNGIISPERKDSAQSTPN